VLCRRGKQVGDGAFTSDDEKPLSRKLASDGNKVNSPAVNPTAVATFGAL
jgi:hypothetical protein